jgi:putative Ca2+/H+ antiporter (TMEM165/GDT1 family)
MADTSLTTEINQFDSSQLQVPTTSSELNLDTYPDGGSHPSTSSSTSSSWEAWKVFGSTFITIFLAELGDKTQLSTLLMTAESHQPWVVFAGAAAALVTTSLLGVWVGCWLSQRLSSRVLDRAAGGLLAAISLWLLWDVAQM